MDPERVTVTFVMGGEELHCFLVPVIIHGQPYTIFVGDDDMVAMDIASTGDPVPVWVTDLLSGTIHGIIQKECGCYVEYDACCYHTFEEGAEQDD